MPTRREILRGSSAGAALLAAPAIVRAQSSLRLDFATIPDPDGWHPSLRLKGDWLVFAVTDGILTGYGEASHSRDDERCRTLAATLFPDVYESIVRRPGVLSREWLAGKEREIAALQPDFVTATALSGINQALYDLLARREQVPVWQLFAATTALDSLPLYTTINRSLQQRSIAEYLDVAAAVAEQGFQVLKCAPFEAVDVPSQALEQSAAGLRTLTAVRERLPQMAIRVDFHERFAPEHFFALLGDFERLRLDWLEEPFPMGKDFAELRRRTGIRIAAGELFWGGARFGEIADNGWADVIMPDVKHVGGFGPLLDVIAANSGKVEVSPHNPSGPISTAASLHAAAVHAEAVRTLEFAFDRAGTRVATGERVDGGRLYLSDAPGWGVEPPRAG
ncbi:MAG TPA: enolase C-terminal domain-like protein [Gammaproteobacteria bacterium]|nr:enolase C-terminal domain-like protein [Gammaproteobacteria bacterium]